MTRHLERRQVGNNVTYCSFHKPLKYKAGLSILRMKFETYARRRSIIDLHEDVWAGGTEWKPMCWCMAAVTAAGAIAK